MEAMTKSALKNWESIKSADSCAVCYWPPYCVCKRLQISERVEQIERSVHPY